MLNSVCLFLKDEAFGDEVAQQGNSAQEETSGNCRAVSRIRGSATDGGNSQAGT